MPAQSMDPDEPAPDRLVGVRRLMDIETRRTMLPPPPSAEDAGWQASWEHLFTTYTPAMQAYVTSLLSGLLGRPAARTEAEDVVQAYLAACVEKGWLARDAQTMHSFRSWLKMQLFRFTCDHIDRMRAKKRQPKGFEDPSVLRGLRARVLDPAEATFDQHLVDAAVGAAVAALASRSEDQAEVIRDLLRQDGDVGTALAERLDRTPEQLAALKRRARVNFAALLAEELKGTVRGVDAFEDLLRDLAPFLP